MKTIITLMAIFAITGIAVAQEKVKQVDIPLVVQTNFTNQYPDASKAAWKMKSEMYIVRFNAQGRKWLAIYNTKGEVQEKGVEMKEVDLPSEIRKAVKNDFADISVDEAFRMEKDGKMCYLLKFNGSEGKKVYYTPKGELMKD
jgi:hypothetical protein